MATKNPSNSIAALFAQSSSGTSSTRDQVVSTAIPSLSTSPSSAASSQSSAMTEQLTSLTQQLQQLQTVNQTQIDTMVQNTQALGQNTTTKGGGSTASSVGGTLLDVLGLGSGLSPLISGLMSLFDGGSSAPAAPVPYIAPLKVHATGGISSSSPGAFAVDSSDGGLPRPAPSAAASPSNQITVQVQAMDSRSFLDHSNDIALAVRQAMLESSVLNDVIRAV